MALTADLLATPVSSGHSPSGTLSGLTAKLASEIRVAELETDIEDQVHAPSPCVERTTRRIQRQAQILAPRRNFTIQEYLKLHSSPGSLTLGQTSARSSATTDEGQEVAEQARTIKDAVSRADGNEQLEDSDRETNPQYRSNVRLETTDSEISAPATERSTVGTPSFTPKRHTIHEIVQRMREVMECNYTDGPGHAYLLYDRAGKSPFLKIGKSVRVSVRKGQHQRECQLEEWDTKQRPVTSIPRPMRLERIVQAELRNMAGDPSCICGVKHQEYFWVSKETGLELLDFWDGWLKVHQPYDEDECLKGFWIDRLDRYQENAHEYFRCDSEQCADQDEDAPACQACLRAGWKKWAEPTASEELEYACREKFSSSIMRRGFLELDRYNFPPKSWLMCLVHFFAQAVCFWRWITDLKVFFHLIQVRIIAIRMMPQVSLPGQCGSGVLSVVDITLWVLCLYHLFQQTKGAAEPGGTPKGKRPARRTSPRKTTPSSDSYKNSSETPDSRDSTRSLAGTKRRRKGA
ncbi:GIY-YIG nuclease family protein [Aspergillus stella-maris]|uniref:GIY-YIG nuclease family protein n=1 Tax=Aspergillus stella-maris TaxID=1810926 RepID=UPI003CCCA9BE